MAGPRPGGHSIEDLLVPPRQGGIAYEAPDGDGAERLGPQVPVPAIGWGRLVDEHHRASRHHVSLIGAYGGLPSRVSAHPAARELGLEGQAARELPAAAGRRGAHVGGLGVDVER